ncbi:MAG: hypothetical protein HN353_11850 [Bdellovibrionales bacterium]|nr:hypothetical protein [Bdellovibrionales bacterium]MBT3526843.1 hypothetical protein [Bdellovibrionales bacterium]MBT7668299.1 hypothetical protein [Bdellovibrionales bacterium]
MQKLLFILITLLTLSANAGTIKTVGCNSGETQKIKSAVRWLKNNISKIDQKMGRNDLMNWPGNSRNKFIKKLDKTLKFHCISQKNRCYNDPNKPGYLLGRVVPVFNQKRVNLCTNNIRTYASDWSRSRLAMYIHVIAHEIAHLVRLNAHRNQCVDKYENPRFSQSVGFAAEYAFASDNYNSADYSSLCP